VIKLAATFVLILTLSMAEACSNDPEALPSAIAIPIAEDPTATPAVPDANDLVAANAAAIANAPADPPPAAPGNVSQPVFPVHRSFVESRTPAPEPTLTPTPRKPRHAVKPTFASDGTTIDDHFALIARQAPGFGGFFYSSPGDTQNINVYLTDDSVDLSSVKQAILSILNPRGYGIDRHVTLHPLPAKYDWLELKHWYDMRYSLPESSLLTSTDMQENENKLEFGVPDEEDILPVTQMFLDAGLPIDAFNVSVVAPAPVS
jgi:hypothetical protein